MLHLSFRALADRPSVMTAYPRVQALGFVLPNAALRRIPSCGFDRE